MTYIKIDRRNFLSALGLGTAHLLLTNPLMATPSTAFADKNPLQLVKLGKSGIQTTLLGIGTGVHAGNRTSFLTRQERNKSVDLLVQSYDRGIRYFDAADTYGTHGILSEAMQKMDRSKVTVVSKMWVRGGGIPEPERPDADKVVDRFRKELKTDYVDLVQIHCMEDPNWTVSQKKQMDILENLKAKGIIKAHGVSVHSLDAMKAAVKSDWVDVIHVRINPYGMAMDKPDPKEVVEVIQQLHQSGKGVIGMKLVGDGKLKNDSKKINDSLQFVLGLGCVDMVIVGFESITEIDDYIGRIKNTLVKL